MSGTSRRLFSRGAAALCLGLMAFSSVAKAATINYGNFNVPVPPTSVDFLNVKESSGTDPVPLYGAPDPFAVGLDFDPTSFTAQSTGGGADITDGQLNYTVMGNVTPGGGVGISSIFVNERGDYTLVGAGTPASQVFAGAIIQAKITAIDGFAVAPINLPSVNASVNFNLVANPGIVQPWALGMSLPVAPFLIANNIPFTIGATKIEVVINNSLVALSEPGSVAFIAKKDFVTGIIPDPHGTPEPATAGLALIGLAGLASRRRRS